MLEGWGVAGCDWGLKVQILEIFFYFNLLSLLSCIYMLRSSVRRALYFLYTDESGAGMYVRTRGNTFFLHTCSYCVWGSFTAEEVMSCCFFFFAVQKHMQEK